MEKFYERKGFLRNSAFHHLSLPLRKGGEAQYNIHCINGFVISSLNTGKIFQEVQILGFQSPYFYLFLKFC